jgi:ribosome-associated protein
VAAEVGASTRSTDSLPVDAGHAIPREELSVKATRSGGPGGQHVNVSSTRIEIRWRPGDSRALTAEERERVAARLASRIDKQGYIRVVASTTRSQLQNRELAEERLAAIVRQALLIPRKRRKTRPPRSARESRVAEKRRLSEKKRERRSRDWD